GAELRGLLGRVQRHVAGAGDHHARALEADVALSQHLADKVDEPVPGGLGARPGAAVPDPLAGDHARLVAAGDLAVLAVQVADLPAAHADVAGGHVEVGADVVGEFGHERLAEAHDLLLALAVRVEIGSALGATEPEPGERVLEDPLEAEELERVLVDGLVEAQSALVRAQVRAELDAEAALDLDGPG